MNDIERVFKVTIHYQAGGGFDSFFIVAANDQDARQKAIEYDGRNFTDNGDKQPEVDYCEISLELHLSVLS
jgi:hypothetical protein